MLTVEISAMSQTLEALRANYEKMGETLATLEGAVNGLIGSWSGSAQEAYATAQREWAGQMKTLHQTLSDVQSALQSATAAYETAERQVESLWQT